MKTIITKRIALITGALVSVFCASGQSFNWASYTAGSSTYSNSTTFNGTSVTMSSSITGSGMVTGYPTYVTGSPSYLGVQVNWPNRTTTVTFTWTFSQPVQGPSFDLYDDDYLSTNHDDRVTITAIDANGNTVYPNITSSIFNTLLGAFQNRIDGTLTNITFTTGPAKINFGTKNIKSITIVYGAGSGPANPGMQEIGFSSIGFISALPIHLSSFTATKSSSQDVLLNWRTQDEKDSKSFIIERASVNKEFEPIGELPAGINVAGPRDYKFMDKGASHGNNFYRLKMVDQDNSFIYSKILMVNVTKLNVSNIYPVPFGDELVINTENEYATTLHISISNLSGQEVYNSEVAVAAGSNSTALSNLGLVEKGMYIINIKESNGALITKQKIVKE